MVNHLVLIS